MRRLRRAKAHLVESVLAERLSRFFVLEPTHRGGRNPMGLEPPCDFRPLAVVVLSTRGNATVACDHNETALSEGSRFSFHTAE